MCSCCLHVHLQLQYSYTHTYNTQNTFIHNWLHSYSYYMQEQLLQKIQVLTNTVCMHILETTIPSVVASSQSHVVNNSNILYLQKSIVLYCWMCECVYIVGWQKAKVSSQLAFICHKSYLQNTKHSQLPFIIFMHVQKSYLQ